MIELHVKDSTGLLQCALGCDAVLFDMDGTLVDSNECIEAAWRAWAAHHELDVEALLRDSHGRRTQETIERFAPHLNTPEELARLRAPPRIAARSSAYRERMRCWRPSRPSAGPW
jgi:beta-phosphoglucomutase-like phosphatase (HAD superfamily)